MFLHCIQSSIYIVSSILLSLTLKSKPLETHSHRVRKFATILLSACTFKVLKKDVGVNPHVIHDYRALNEKTVKDHTPLPRQDEILELLVNAIIHGKIDLVNAYYQMRMPPEHIYKTVIRNPFGLYEWTAMPEVLCSAPVTFQRYMNYVLRKYIGRFCAVYLDNIDIFSNSVEEHKQHVHLILQTLWNHGVTASPEKSTLFADRIKFLEHFVSERVLKQIWSSSRRSPTGQHPLQQLRSLNSTA